MQALEAGGKIVESEIARGLDMVATGDMGIGNTTPSAAIAAVFTGNPVDEITGRGTGVDDAGLQRKIGAIERALHVNQPEPERWAGRAGQGGRVRDRRAGRRHPGCRGAPRARW